MPSRAMIFRSMPEWSSHSDTPTTLPQCEQTMNAKATRDLVGTTRCNSNEVPVHFGHAGEGMERPSRSAAQAARGVL